jgi:uncharacterized RDD family membrane protein YckC
LTGPKGGRPAGSVPDGEARRVEDVVIGAAAIGFGVAWRVGRIVSMPARAVARSFLVEPVADGLAAAGREARADGRRKLEATAAGIIAAPATSRTIEHALVQPPPQALNGEAIERIVQRVLDSPTFERVARTAGESRVVQELMDDAVRSEPVQRAVEELIVGPAIQRALERQTRTFWNELTSLLRVRARLLDERIESFAHRVVRRAPRAEPAPYTGIAGRGAAFAIDFAITQVAVLVIGALIGFLVSLTALSADGWLVGVLAGVGWALFVAAYAVFFWSTVGQTPGEHVLAVRVIDPHGKPPSVGRSLLRVLGTWLAIFPLFAGFLPVLFDRRRRALQDYIAGTLVVNVVDEPAPVSAPPPPPAR